VFSAGSQYGRVHLRIIPIFSRGGKIFFQSHFKVIDLKKIIFCPGARL
jgi:hypothetical protein